MSQARVTSIQALRDLRGALQRFIEEAAAAMSEADSEALNTAQWLRFERITFWQNQVRQRHDAVQAAKNEMARKKLTSFDNNPTAIDLRRAIERAQRREDEAQERVQRVKRWLPVLERETMLYKGGLQPLADAVARDLPAAMLRLERMVRSLEEYAAVAAAGVSNAAQSPAGPRDLSATHPDSAATAAAEAMLRRRTPRRAVRDSLELMAAGAGARALGGESAASGLGGLAGGVLAETGAPAVMPAPADRVVVELGALGTASIYLERLADVSPGDSGWHIGAAAAAAPAGGAAIAPAAHMCVIAADVLARQPALAEILQLPPGYLVVLSAVANAAPQEAHGWHIEAIIGPDDRQVSR